ncbi:hypothetical protein [Streptomyces sp. bgisy095]|uniref:hypothetical protein n=1 Tax=unclassified Streptomyces TaxID=2593676 RepID=UPI003D7587E6
MLGVVTDDGSTQSGCLIDGTVREGARRMPAAPLEAEADQYMARLSAETDEHGRLPAVRNGHHRPRTVVTAAVPVAVIVPCVNARRADERTRFSSKTLTPWRRKSPKTSEVLLRSPRGLSLGDFVYVWADGVHSKVRPGRAHSCALVLLGVRLDGAEELIALADSLRSLAAGNALATARQRPVAPSPIMSPGSQCPVGGGSCGRTIRERHSDRVRGASRMNVHDIPQNPDEHVRFAVHLDRLRHVADPDEVELVSRVLTDPDRTMAQSAVLRHLDRRAADLHPGPAYEEWAQAMTRATIDHPFLTRRLQEWSLFRAVTLKLPWRPDDLLASSDWLQSKTAVGTNTEAVEILAELGRTKRIRNAARNGLNHRSES